MSNNMEQCPYFNNCSQNLCPLDPKLSLRVGKKSDKCRFMRGAKVSKIGSHEFISGGTQMPDALLNLVPESNLSELNEASKARWQEIKKNN